MPQARELMETSELFLRKTCPLVVTELDAVEDNSKLVSTDSKTMTTVVPVMHAVKYSNSGPGDLFIIIEESKENQGETP